MYVSCLFFNIPSAMKGKKDLEPARWWRGHCGSWAWKKVLSGGGRRGCGLGADVCFRFSDHFRDNSESELYEAGRFQCAFPNRDVSPRYTGPGQHRRSVCSASHFTLAERRDPADRCQHWFRLKHIIVLGNRGI